MTALLVTSHNRDEVERLCDRVVFVAVGHVVADSSPEEVAARFDHSELEGVWLARDPSGVVMSVRHLRTIMRVPLLRGVAEPVDVEDVDATIAAVPRSLRAVDDEFYGDRSGQLEDPCGHRWSAVTHVEDVSPEEMGERTRAMGGSSDDRTSFAVIRLPLAAPQAGSGAGTPGCGRGHGAGS